MLFQRLSAVLSVATCGIILTIWAPASPAGVILDPVNPIFSGTGLGSQLTLLTIQDTGGPPTGMESGCVTWGGAADTIGGCGAPFNGDDEKTGASQTLTRTFGAVGWDGPEDVGVVFNAGEPGGNSIDLDDLSLFFFQPDGTLFFEAELVSPQSFANTNTGVGKSGFLFRLDAAQQTSLAPLFTSLADPNNRIGAAFAASNAQGAPDTLFAIDLQPAPVPEPASLFLVGSGLLGLFAVARWRMSRR